MKKNKNSIPTLSVVMPVYNAGKFLEESIESILNQTFRDFEFIIVDDRSDDNSWEILQTYASLDSRIKLLRNDNTLGISTTVKRAMDICSGEFIARMDADDISLPERFQREIEYLSSHKDTVAVGAQCQVIDEHGNITGEKKFPLSFPEIYRYIFHFVPLQQPTLMIAKSRLPDNFIYYYDGMNTAEEIELIFKLFRHGKVENLPDFLLKYRLHGNNTSLKNIKKTFVLTLLSRFKGITKYGYKPTPQGIIITFIQSIIVLVMPKKIIFALYVFMRDFSFIKLKSLLSGIRIKGARAEV